MSNYAYFDIFKILFCVAGIRHYCDADHYCDATTVAPLL